jgi:hypothetical protein
MDGDTSDSSHNHRGYFHVMKSEYFHHSNSSWNQATTKHPTLDGNKQAIPRTWPSRMKLV